MKMWDVFHQMYESQVCRGPETRETGFSISFSFGQVPTFALQLAIQALSAAIGVLFPGLAGS